MKKRVRIAVIGSTGRMGQEILQLTAEDSRFTPVAGLARGETALVQVNCKNLKGLPAQDLDVVIDFSQPELFKDVLDWCVKHKVALVSGVTGLTPAHQRQLQSAGSKVAILWAPNMSLGVAVLAEMLQALALLPEFEFQIEEVHHKRKKDKPSGTALFLQKKLETAVGGGVPEPLALRGGGVFGIHKIWAMGEEEVITLEHSAMNRKVFARGALQAAAWIQGRKAGLYVMSDVLKVKSPSKHASRR